MYTSEINNDYRNHDNRTKSNESTSESIWAKLKNDTMLRRASETHQSHPKTKINKSPHRNSLKNRDAIPSGTRLSLKSEGKQLYKILTSSCENLPDIKIRPNMKKNTLQLRHGKKQVATVSFSKVDGDVFLKFSSIPDSDDKAYETFSKILNELKKDRRNSVFQKDGQSILSFGNQDVILPTAVTEPPDSNLNYENTVEEEITRIGQAISGENFDINDPEQKSQATTATALTAITAIDDESYSTPLTNRERSASFLEGLKNMLDRFNIGKHLSEILDHKIARLRSISYSKQSLSHVIDLYQSALTYANLEKQDVVHLAHDMLAGLRNEYNNREYSKSDSKNRKAFLELAERAKMIYQSSFPESETDRIKPCLVEALNRCPNAWETVKHSFKYLDQEGSEFELVSTTTPVREAKIFQHLDTEHGGVRGISSNDRNSEHLQNAWTTKLEIENKVLFKGLRHGCIANKDPHIQENRAQELIQMSIFEQLGQEAFDNIKDGDTINLNLASTQLLTHTKIAGDGKIGLKQIEELQKYNISKNPGGKIFEIKLPNGETKRVNLNLHLLTFNFGVNIQTRFKLGRSAKEDKINFHNLKKMLGGQFFKSPETGQPGGLLGEKLKALDREIANSQNSAQRAELQYEKKILNDSAKQIRDLWITGDYRAANKNPYAMPARVALIAYKLGFMTSFNCKSGKDRTGVADAEIKNLAAYIEVNRRIPPLHEKMSEIDRQNFTNVHSNCGSNEVLVSCTGVMGSKIPFMNNFYERFTDDYVSEFLGVTNNFGIM